MSTGNIDDWAPIGGSCVMMIDDCCMIDPEDEISQKEIESMCDELKEFEGSNMGKRTWGINTINELIVLRRYYPRVSIDELIMKQIENKILFSDEL